METRPTLCRSKTGHVSRASARRKKRRNPNSVLAPTHEEVITDLVATNLNSYRHLPKTFYQIQTKFRNEIRPRFGLMRAKEFSMKDAYSFDATDEAATVSYQKMYQAYERIFSRIGLKAMVVEADTGVMGGSFSHEFSVPCSVGESEIVFTEDGSYAAAIEKAISQHHPRDNPTQTLAIEKFATPDVVTIEDLTQKHNVAARDQIKTLVYLCDEIKYFLNSW
ncbi:MAG: aminoacyl--tRNA ligase-related protein [Verrucomicrobiia bacterium]